MTYLKIKRQIKAQVGGKIKIILAKGSRRINSNNIHIYPGTKHTILKVINEKARHGVLVAGIDHPEFIFKFEYEVISKPKKTKFKRAKK